MAVKQEIKEVIRKPLNEVYNNLIKNLEGSGWSVIYTDRFRADGREVLEIFGMSSALGGSTTLSFVTHGARYVPFFVKIKEADYSTPEVYIIAGGAETIFGFDFGRNKKVVEKIMKFCE